MRTAHFFSRGFLKRISIININKLCRYKYLHGRNKCTGGIHNKENKLKNSMRKGNR
jgi:hypothetical protein